jgi:small-conductance mechanosensitive channel
LSGRLIRRLAIVIASLCALFGASAGNCGSTQARATGGWRLFAARAGSARTAGAASSSAASSSASATGSASLPAPPPILPDQVIGYIRHTLDWYRGMQSLEARPRFSQDVDARSRLQRAALDAVRLAFGFGHAAAADLSPRAQASAAATPEARFDQAVARIDARMTALEAQIAEIDARLARAAPKLRKALIAQRADAVTSLALERQVKSLVQTLQKFEDSTIAPQATGARGLDSEIENLERTVPEALTPAPGLADRESRLDLSAGARSSASDASRNASTATASAAPFQPESAGIVTLIGEWVGLHGDARRSSSAAAATRALRRRLEDLHDPLRAEARELVRTEVPDLDTMNVAQLDAMRRALEAASTRFKQLTVLLVPLAEQSLTLADAQGVLTQWAELLDAREATIARYLLTRVAFLVSWIVAVLVFSEIWRRALFRYFHDPRRRSHFQTLRRVTVGVALMLVLIFGLVSEIGSLATYVGFLTAGLAVALQNVILAVVAYFLLIGRYGVRIGDRVTLTGVTGRVADIGLIRIYLLELAGPELTPTGRLVVFSNAVLFQPQAMFKQVSGVDYLWHVISIKLAPSVDVRAAEKRLQAAVDSVYEQYRPRIEKQHADMKRLVELETGLPWPQLRVRYSGEGLRFEIRYPVEIDQAVLVDRQMLDALNGALGTDPPLPVADAGQPTIEASAG